MPVFVAFGIYPIMEIGVRDVLAFAWRQWRKDPLRVGVASALMLGATSIDVIGPLAIGRLVDALAGVDPAPGAVVSALIFYLSINVVFQIFHKSADYMWCGVIARILRRLGADAFARVQRYSADWHADTFAGSTVRNVTRGMWAFDTLGDALFFSIVPSIAVLIGAVMLMLAYSPVLGVVFFFSALTYGAVAVYLSLTWVAPTRRAAAEMDSKLGGALADAITCNAVVKSMAAEQREDARLGGVLDLWRARMARSWYVSIHTIVIQNVVLIVMQALLVGGAVWLWSLGRATPGDVTYVLMSFGNVARWLRDIGMQLRNAQQAVNDMERLVEYELTDPSVADPPGAMPLTLRLGAVRFDKVRFHYKGHALPLFDGLEVEVAAGERVALVGHSGSGKTTFTKLLQRLYDVQGGQILIDGQDIAGVTLDSLRQAIAVVPQEPILFHRSLAENIAYGRPEASAAEIEHAARLAHAHEFIAVLPTGYATLVGERGVKLSGGERQRVAIARAILADRPILVLDEATSSLDSETERLIQDALEKLMEGRTTVIIAHRLSTVRAVDRIIVFEAGKIVETGDHAQLLARPQGHYRRLHSTQAQGLAA